MAKWLQWVSGVAVAVGFTAGVIVLLLWLAGTFDRKVPMNAAQAGVPEFKGRTTPVRQVEIPRFESAVGTIRAVRETNIGSKLLAKVLEINLKAGQKVQKGDVLARLDDTDLRARVQQAQAALLKAEKVQAQAAAEEKRYADMLKGEAVTRQAYDKVFRELGTANADVKSARKASRKLRRRWTGPLSVPLSMGP